jgi:taurine transport system substrate-binding protein
VMHTSSRPLGTPLLGLAILAVGAIALAACGSSASSSGKAGASGAAGSSGVSSGSSSSSSGNVSVGVGYFQSATIGPEVLVAGNPDLAGKVGGKIKLSPIDSGVAGLAELRGGAFPFVSGVGNPPVVGAIANNTKLKVIYAEYFDAAQLIVGPNIKANSDLAGKTVGDLQGSSEDFEIRGWLSTQGLTGKVKVVGFPSEAAVEAAFKAKRIDGAYVEIAQALDLEKTNKGRQVVTAQQIAKLGFPSLNVLAVTDDFASKHRDVVQNFVCQIMHAQAISTGPDADTYISKASGLVGSPPAQAIAATKIIPFVPANEELSWFQSPTGTVADGQMAKAYALTGKFLKDQGRVTAVPTTDQIAAHLDSSYVQQAVKDNCAS